MDRQTVSGSLNKSHVVFQVPILLDAKFLALSDVITGESK